MVPSVLELLTLKVSFQTKAVYNPKAFVLHAASHHQTFVHCERFSTAASRRSLGSVSVPVWLIILSDQLPVKSLGKPLPYQQADRTQAHLKAVGPKIPTFELKKMSSKVNIEDYHRFRDAILDFKENYLRVTHPFAANPERFARLACLIHAASVHSEPGSNSPK